MRAMVLVLLFAVLHCRGLKEKGKHIPRFKSRTSWTSVPRGRNGLPTKPCPFSLTPAGLEQVCHSWALSSHSVNADHIFLVWQLWIQCSFWVGMCAAQLAEGLPSTFKTLGCIHWAWWHIPADLAVGRWRQGVRCLSSGYVANYSQPARATWNLSQNKMQAKKTNKNLVFTGNCRL